MEFNREQIVKDLKETICQVIFTKVNGEKRVMNCTLNPSLIKEETTVSDSSKEKKKPNPDVLPVYDLETNGWRSFRWDSLESFRKVSNL